MSDKFELRALSGALGAEIHGMDLSRPLSQINREKLVSALNEYGVLCVRDQKLTHDSQIALARLFGEPDVHPIAKGLDSHPEVVRVLKPAGERAFFGTSWHTDNSFFERPSAVTILYGEQVPPVGGDTVYASMERAWEMLSEPLQRFLRPLHAIHSAEEAYDPRTTGDAKYKGETAIEYVYSDAIYEQVEHPVVRTHPATGRLSLYVNPMFTRQIIGLGRIESDRILSMLYELATRPELTCRIRWENGTVAIWDNRCLQHYAIDDYADFDRLMYRVTVAGERPA